MTDKQPDKSKLYMTVNDLFMNTSINVTDIKLDVDKNKEDEKGIIIPRIDYIGEQEDDNGNR